MELVCRAGNWYSLILANSCSTNLHWILSEQKNKTKIHTAEVNILLWVGVYVARHSGGISSIRISVTDDDDDEEEEEGGGNV